MKDKKIYFFYKINKKTKKLKKLNCSNKVEDCNAIITTEINYKNDKMFFTQNLEKEILNTNLKSLNTKKRKSIEEENFEESSDESTVRVVVVE
jgi:hypothetical protein